jgi:hypothetical protein
MEQQSLPHGIHKIKEFSPSRLFQTLEAFYAHWKKQPSHEQPALAWIFPRSALCTPVHSALYGIGFSPELTFFIETDEPVRALRAVCSENFFHVVVYNSAITKVALQYASRWLKPANQSLVTKGSEFEKLTTQKLIIFAGDS